MTIQKFLSFLIEATPEQQTMFHKLSMKLHPDRKEGKLELMKQLNAYKDAGNWSAIEKMYKAQIGEPPRSKKKNSENCILCGRKMEQNEHRWYKVGTTPMDKRGPICTRCNNIEETKKAIKIKKPSFNVFDRMMAWEDGSLEEDDTIELFQHLVDTGQAWTLQGMYGRMARDLIDAGMVIQHTRHH